MPRWFIATLLVPVVVVASLAQPPVAPPPRLITERDAFFRDGKVLTLSLEFDKKAADTLRREPKLTIRLVNPFSRCVLLRLNPCRRRNI